MERRHFNSFSSVGEILEVMFTERENVNRSKRYPRLSPEVGVRRDIPRLGIQSPGEKFVVRWDWDENEIF